MTNMLTENLLDRSDVAWNQLGQLIDENTAEAAAECVKEIMQRPELSFVYDTRGDDQLRHLGIWQPRTPHDWGTIYAHPSVVEHVRPLMDVIESVTASDEGFTNSKHVVLMAMSPRHSVPEHQDFTRDGSREQRRRIVNLAGFSVITCFDPATRAGDAFALCPGQAYDLEITNSFETSPSHSIEAVGNLSRISSMFISKDLAQ